MLNARGKKCLCILLVFFCSHVKIVCNRFDLVSKETILKKILKIIVSLLLHSRFDCVCLRDLGICMQVVSRFIVIFVRTFIQVNELLFWNKYLKIYVKKIIPTLIVYLSRFNFLYKSNHVVNKSTWVPHH